jgi:aconitate hydratase
VDSQGRPCLAARDLADRRARRGAQRRFADRATYRELYADRQPAGQPPVERASAPKGERYTWSAVDLHRPSALPGRPDTGARCAATHHRGARALAIFGDSVTTDHISPAGSIKPGSPGRAPGCRRQGVAPADFNSYGSRRGQHEVMLRGTLPTRACAT